MALGGADGFRVSDSDRFQTVEEQSLLVMPQQLEVALPNPDLPEVVLSAIAAVTVRASTVAGCAGVREPVCIKELQIVWCAQELHRAVLQGRHRR